MLGNLEQANAIAELRAIEQRTRREAESLAAQIANHTDYHLTPEDYAALERGDRQRETGVYVPAAGVNQGALPSNYTCKCDGVTEPDVDSCYRCDDDSDDPLSVFNTNAEQDSRDWDNYLQSGRERH